MVHPEAGHKGLYQSNQYREEKLGKCKNTDGQVKPRAPEKEIGNDGSIHGKFKVAGHEDKPQVKSAVIKDHYLMDHGKFKMRFGIINRHAAILDRGNHHQD